VQRSIGQAVLQHLWAAPVGVSQIRDGRGYCRLEREIFARGGLTLRVAWASRIGTLAFLPRTCRFAMALHGFGMDIEDAAQATGTAALRGIRLDRRLRFRVVGRIHRRFCN
jgi:hypothetical protein